MRIVTHRPWTWVQLSLMAVLALEAQGCGGGGLTSRSVAGSGGAGEVSTATETTAAGGASGGWSTGVAGAAGGMLAGGSGGLAGATATTSVPPPALVAGTTVVAPEGGTMASGGTLTKPPVLGGTTVLSSVVGGATLPKSSVGGATSSGGATVTAISTHSGGLGGTAPVAGAAGGSTAGSVATTGSQPGAAVVTFSSGQGVGVMNGYAWVATSAAATITDPLCGGQPIVSMQPCAKIPSWNSARALCISGSIPALVQTSMGPDYSSNWGLTLGVNAGVENPMTGVRGTLGRAYKSVAFKLSGTPLSGLYASIQKQGDYQTYLAKLTPGVPIPFTEFATDYYQATPKGLFSAADIPKIEAISIAVRPDNQLIAISNLCWEELVLAE